MTAVEVHFTHSAEGVLVSAGGAVATLDAEAVLSLIAAIASGGEHTIALAAIDVDGDVSRPKPTMMPPRAPQASALTTADAVPAAVEWARVLQFSRQQVLEARDSPQSRRMTADSTAWVQVRGDVGVLVGAADSIVLSVFRAEDADRRYPPARSWGKRSAGSGGSERHGFPETVDELLERARHAGLQCELRPGSGHWRITGTDGRSCTTAATPSDVRSLRNSVMQIRSDLRVDLRTMNGRVIGPVAD
ncbi:hypothetical protein [Agrococcus casei]|uniref:hypothetical protein n=1 Tax=Agrococcus casei TaxID=343512 RepID=UPI000B361F67|nr:hypothetical protein [Agrococcus casei]